MLIKAMLFDLDETLVDRDATVQAYLKDQHRRYNLEHLPFEVYRDRFRELKEHGYAESRWFFVRSSRSLISQLLLKSWWLTYGMLGTTARPFPMRRGW